MDTNYSMIVMIIGIIIIIIIIIIIKTLIMEKCNTHYSERLFDSVSDEKFL